MGVCVYTPAFALNAGMKNSNIFVCLSKSEWMRSVVQCVTVCFCFSYWIWIMGNSAGHWPCVHIVHNNGESFSCSLILMLLRLNIHDLLSVTVVSSTAHVGLVVFHHLNGPWLRCCLTAQENYHYLVKNEIDFIPERLQSCKKMSYESLVGDIRL